MTIFPSGRLTSIFGATCLCIALLTSVSQAQIPSSPNSLDLSVSTENPAPGQMVTVTAQSFSSDIDGATISWSSGGTVLKRGVGATTLQVAAPALGKKTLINVSAQTSDGKILRNTITIASGAIDMILESNGYTPPLFAGKIDPVYQNTVKVIAVPHLADSSGVEYAPSALIYKWKKNGVLIQESSGYNKQSLTIVGDVIPRPYTISVEVSSRSQTAQATGYIAVTPGEPTITMYVDDPLYGPLFNRAVNSSVRIGLQKEVAVRAVPYGFNKPANSLGSLTMNWLINGSEHEELATHDTVILRSPEGEAGSSNIQLTIRNEKDILQGATGGFSVMFTGPSQTTAQTSVTF